MSDETVTAHSQSKFNGYVGVAALGLLGWVLVAVLSSNDKITKMETSMGYMQGQISNLVTRPELDSKMKDIQNENLRFQNELLKQQKEAQPTTKR